MSAHQKDETEPRTCGECRWYDADGGECCPPIPVSITKRVAMFMPEEAGADCPCFEPRTPKQED